MRALRARAPAIARDCRRRGTTLLELIVSTALLGIVLAMLAVGGGRVQRVHTALRTTVDARRPLREGAMVVAAELRELSGAAGDVAADPGADSALAVRTLVTRGVLCEGSPPVLRADWTRELTRTPEATDTLWVLAGAAGTSAPTWLAWRVSAVSVATGGDANDIACPADPGPSFAGDSTTAPAWHLVVAEDDAGAPGLASVLAASSPLAARVTRRARYTLYRGGDGAWQLGYREWNGASGSFQGVQPVSGAYASATAAGGAGITFGLTWPAADSSANGGQAAPAGVRLELRAARAGEDLSGSHRQRSAERQQLRVGILRQ